jgi:hypothetical protein
MRDVRAPAPTAEADGQSAGLRIDRDPVVTRRNPTPSDQVTPGVDPRPAQERAVCPAALPARCTRP